MTYRREVRLSDIVLPKFREYWRDTRDSSILYHVLKGGRGSGKSSVVSIRLVMDIVEYPITALCVRKVGNTLQESCYEQIKEAIEYLGLGDKFRFFKSPLKIEYLPRGNSIIFRGADDPLKIKSIKVSKYPIARLWIEETAEFQTEEEVSIIVNSVLRAELPEDLVYKIYYTYNPPKMRQSWVNVLFNSVNIPPNTRVYHSTYLDNPYISEAFIQEAELVKERRPEKYRWEYLGEAIGAGVVPFDNLLFEPIADELIRQFDNIRQGVDWGYATDPFHLSRMHYDKTRRRLYIFGEIHRIKMSNREAFDEIKKRGWHNDRTLADSAEPKSVAEMKDYGMNIYGARKGPGSVEYGEKWLDDLDAIIIDPVRCPNTAREFESIDYMTDRMGNIIPRLQDYDNHSIDAVRYGMSEDMRRPLFSFK